MQEKRYLPVTPIGKPRMTRSDKWKKRPAVVRYHEYKDALRELNLDELPPRFDITFNIPMPTSWSKKKQAEMFGKPHQQRPDIDNLLKAFLDALCIDDSYVYDVSMRKRWSILGSMELIVETKYNDFEKE